jgi:hypothetical protein
MIYATAVVKSNGNSEDQKAAFFSEGKLEFGGAGTLTISGQGVSKHALCSDDKIDIESGTIIIASALKDGIHVSDGLKINGGTVNVTAAGDAIDGDASYIEIAGGNITTTTTVADTKGIKCDSILIISDGTINMAVGGLQSKGIKAGQNMTLSGGNITINTTGGVALTISGSGFNPSYCTAISCDSSILVSGATIVITSTGIAGKGIMANGDVNITSGSVNIITQGLGATYTNSLGIIDSYSSTCIGSDDNISILGGTVATSCSGTGGKGIVADDNLTFGILGTSSPSVNVTTTGTRLLVSGTGAAADYADPRAIKSNGILTINNGTFTITTSQIGGDGIVCDSFLYVNGGTITETIGGNETKGIRGTQAMTFNGGDITINNAGGVDLVPSGSGYDPSYSTSIKCDGTITVNGASISITTTGAGGKGIKSDKCVNITSGTVIINASGTGAIYKNTTGATDTYFSTCISSNGNVNILGGTINIKNTGLAGKGIAADDTLLIGDANNSPTITVSTTGEGILLSGSGQNANYSISKALKGVKVLTINNGTIEINSSTASGGFGGGEGLESYTLTINGGIIHIAATDDGINTSKGGETMTGSDGSSLNINGGTITINTTRGDGIDCNGSIVMTGGIVIDNGPSSAPEEGIDFNGTFNMLGGYIISSGSNSMFNQPLSASSTQRNMYISSTNQIAAGTIFHIQDASSNDVLTFKPVKAYYSIVFSSSVLTTGVTYSIYTGGSYTGGTSTYGLYSGGIYSTTGATLKKSVILSTSSTANTITF